MYRKWAFAIQISTIFREGGMHDFRLPLLPTTDMELESRLVLRQPVPAHRYLAELKGMVATIPNESLLTQCPDSSWSKEQFRNQKYHHNPWWTLQGNTVSRVCRQSRHQGGQWLRCCLAHRPWAGSSRQVGYSYNRLLDIHRVLEQNNAGLCRLPGAELKSLSTGETIYRLSS